MYKLHATAVGLKAHSMVQKTVQPRAMTKAEMVAVNQR